MTISIENKIQEQERAAFQDSRNTLLSARIQARLQNERKDNEWLNSVLQEEERKSGYSKPVPMVNQSTFLSMLYATALWLREKYFLEDSSVRILRKHIQPFVENKSIKFKYGPKATEFTKNRPEQFARRIRNALGHASVTVSEKSFTFKDINLRDENDWVEIEMPWPIVGAYTESLITAGNELLYPEYTIPPNEPKIMTDR